MFIINEVLKMNEIKAGQKEVFYSGYYQTDKIELPEPVEDSVSSLFSFPDIDYNDKSRSAWDLEKHFR